MGTHNICFYKKVDKKYTGCNLKTMELLDYVLIGVCAVVRSNTVISSTVDISVHRKDLGITKTRLFIYIEHFTSQN